MNSSLHNRDATRPAGTDSIRAMPSFAGVPLNAKPLETLMEELAGAAKTESDPVAFFVNVAARLRKRD